MAEEVRIDETEMEDEGIAEMLIDENATAQMPRPGTSFTRPMTGSGPSQGVRPVSKSGRAVTGYMRPGTTGGRPSTVEAAMRGRTATARPVTSASGRFVRLGTVSATSVSSYARRIATSPAAHVHGYLVRFYRPSPSCRSLRHMRTAGVHGCWRKRHVHRRGQTGSSKVRNATGASAGLVFCKLDGSPAHRLATEDGSCLESILWLLGMSAGPRFCNAANASRCESSLCRVAHSPRSGTAVHSARGK